ncbi:hypothetical protein A2U01_0056674 [Trifolium medium]|uniref:Uncharacterized protein n=1 Tax=Trifolium medium TaxID=97028 RepID=A0A392RFQ8_9FABA|nr:hypothetical protein [Trifolium medium]
MYKPPLPLNPTPSPKPFATLIGAQPYKPNLMPYTTTTLGILLVGPLIKIWLAVNGYFESNEIRTDQLIVTRLG